MSSPRSSTAAKQPGNNVASYLSSRVDQVILHLAPLSLDDFGTRRRTMQGSVLHGQDNDFGLRDRIEWVDAAKGIGILLVVLGHSWAE